MLGSKCLSSLSYQPQNCTQIRKIASTSDFSNNFEVFLQKWILEDIDKSININQFAGRRGMGMEHIIVAMVDRVLQLLDKPGMSAVVATAVDWMGLFDRLYPTITIIKLVSLGVKPFLVPIIIEEDDSEVQHGLLQVALPGGRLPPGQLD